ncbi:MAG: tetratricopeptide repeat protein [Planctomycetaceae bacterium]|nr:tetratricopeptide repeat protein [Planctomycetaceae bacterium]
MKQPPRKIGAPRKSGPPPPKPVARPDRDDDDGPDDPARLRIRRLDANRYALLIPITALDRQEDIDEVKVMIAAGELDIARDELLYLVSDCRGFLEAHNLLGELALEEHNVSLAQGHFGFAYEIGVDSLPPGFRGRLPANKEYNGAFFLAGRGVARCLIARGQIDKGREVLELLARLDPQEATIRGLLAELKEREPTN